MADLSGLQLKNTSGNTLSTYSLIENLANAIEKVNDDGSSIDAAITDKDTSTTTASNSFVDMANMTATPAAGSYLVQFSATVSNDNPAETVSCQIADGNDVPINASLRALTFSDAGEKKQVHALGVITVNGSLAIKVIWKVSGGNGTCYERQMCLTKIA